MGHGNSKPDYYKDAMKKFGEAEIQMLHQTFDDLAARSHNTRTVDKSTFLKVFSLPGILGDRMFAVFDRKHTGCIDWQEFIGGLGLLVRGSLDDKVEFVFNMYDLGEDGGISKQELHTVLSSVILSASIILEETVNQHRRDSITENMTIDALDSMEQHHQQQEEDSISESNNIFRTQSLERSGAGDGSKVTEEKVHERVNTMVKEAFVNAGLKENEKMSKAQFTAWCNKHPEVLRIVFSAFGPITSTSSPAKSPNIPKPRPQPLNIAKTNTFTVREVISPRLDYDSDGSLSKDHHHNSFHNLPIMPFSNTISTSSSSSHIGYEIECVKCNLKLRIRHCHKCGIEYPNGNTGNCATCGPVLDIPMQYCISCGHDLNITTLEPNMLNNLDPTWNTIHSKVLSNSNIVGEQNKQMVQGYLMKVGKHLKHVILRWFSVQDNFMYEFHQPLSKKPSHVHYLEGSFIEAVDHSSKDPKLKYGFEILFSEETRANRILYAKSEEDQLRWIKALRTIAHDYDIEEFYEIGDKVGVGRFGTVYKARSKATNNVVAVKIIDKEGLDDDDREAIRSEIAVLKLLSHRNIVNLVNVFESRSAMHLVMDFVEGGDLAHRLAKDGPLTEEVTKSVIFGTLTGLRYLHSTGIVHRDIKPENLMMKSNSFSQPIVIGDFGHSRFTSPMEIMRMPCGTLAFIAPEVLDLRGYGKSVDVWSLGVTMYQCLTNTLPFYSEDRGKLMDLIVKSKLSFDEEKWKNISPNAIDLLKKMLTNNANNRISIDDACAHPWFEDLRANAPLHISTPTKCIARLDLFPSPRPV